MKPFNVTRPPGQRVPILLSIPHCGIEFPNELQNEFKRDLTEHPDDTDWYVDRLYDFATAEGITIINSVYHRWVIDLNRSPDDAPLYTDGRIITGLCPTTDFKGAFLYNDDRKVVDKQEIARRVTHYYLPYHSKLRELLDELKGEFSKVLLWECHSIRQYVPTIYKEKFPDLILGDSEGASAGPNTIKVAYDSLNTSDFSVSHNFPFKGGYITRAYGKPLQMEEAIQLEMSKINYMDDRELDYDEQRAERIRQVLRHTMRQLAAHLLVKN